MSINRVHKKGNYSVIANNGAHDATLTWQARGILWYLLTKPDGWLVRTHDLVKQSPVGLKAVNTILKELEINGYLIRWCDRGDRGKFEWRSEIFESKQDAQEWYLDHQTKLEQAFRLSIGTKEKLCLKDSATPPSGIHGGRMYGSSTYGRRGGVLNTELENPELENIEELRAHPLTGGELNVLIELTQESECAIAEEFSHLKEDSLTKKKAGTRSRTIQQTESTLEEAKDLEIKTPTPQPPSPRLDRPTKKSKNPLDALTEDSDGWLVAPTKGTYKLAGIITLRRMQYAIADTFLDESYEFEFNEDGELEAIYKGDVLTWQEFEKDYAIGKLRTIALHDPAASGCCDRGWWDETIKEFFLESVEFCKRNKDALTVSRSQPASVLFGDIEPDEDDED